jgi:hypothetical protein
MTSCHKIDYNKRYLSSDYYKDILSSLFSKRQSPENKKFIISSESHNTVIVIDMSKSTETVSETFVVGQELISALYKCLYGILEKTRVTIIVALFDDRLFHVAAANELLSSSLIEKIIQDLHSKSFYTKQDLFQGSKNHRNNSLFDMLNYGLFALNFMPVQKSSIVLFSVL